MCPIGDATSGLERRGAGFTVESLAKELRQEWIEEALRATKRESVRVRLLPATLTVWFVILMGVFRRTSYVNLLEKLHGTWWTHERWSSEKPPCSRAVTKARDRIGVEPMETLFKRAASEWLAGTEGLVVRGLRVQSFDGSTMKTPDTPKNSRRFGRPGSSRGRAAYPQLRIVALADVGTRIIVAARWSRYRKAEIDLARDLVSEVAPGCLILVDSGLFAYDLLWGIRSRGANFVARIGAQAKPKVLRELGPGDAIVEVTLRSYHRKRHRDMPRKWTLRMITYRPEGADEEIRLLTDLMPESGFTHEELADLYHDRWEDETIFDEMKTHLCECATVNRPVVFRSKTPDRVVQELWGMLIAYNAIRKTMQEAARRKELDPRRVSFTSATERVREATYEMMRLPTARLAGRYERMLIATARVVVPKRPGRRFPRAVKIKMSCYPLKRRRRRA
ncbi:MAG: IS4 family transposase [Gemmatimonadota bacterium]|nr:MAG: IS4 family transposase [Gemmatimonadota bacterium]